jgi:hypothetical protein
MIHSPAFSIHAYFYLFLLKKFEPDMTGEQTSLFRVYNIRLPIVLNKNNI